MERELRIAEWPVDERPRERLYHKGAAALSDAELLAIQLGTGIRGMSALDVARGLLTQFGTLQELASREVAEVAGVRGVGRARAVRGVGRERTRDLQGAPLEPMRDRTADFGDAHDKRP